jgi:uncharacterized protein YdaU (DUF1376 family)
MAALPFFAFWPRDFIADSQHMTTQEIGASVLLICAAWLNPDCALPDDDKQLARITKCTMAQWIRIKETVLKSWKVGTNGRLHQHRLDQERKKAIEKSHKARASAFIKWLNQNDFSDANAQRTHNERSSIHSHSHNQTPQESFQSPENWRQPSLTRGLQQRAPWRAWMTGYIPGGKWDEANQGPRPESSDDNPNIPSEVRKIWLKTFGLPNERPNT